MLKAQYVRALPVSVLCVTLLATPHARAQTESYWFKRTDLPTPRQELQPVGLNGRIHVFGGIRSDREVTDLHEVFDVATDSWFVAAPLPEPRHHYAAATFDGRIYVFGGYGTSLFPWSPNMSVFQYEPGSDTWTELDSMPRPRAEHVAVTYENRVYLLGGNGMPLTDVFDPATGDWSSAAMMPIARNHQSFGVIDTLIYLVAGRDSDWFNFGELQAFAPGSNTWYTFAPLLIARSGQAGGTLAGRIFAFGGEVPPAEGGPSPAMIPSQEEYDPLTDTWYLLPDMLTPRHGTAAVPFGDTIYVIGGGPRPGYGVSPVNEAFVLGTCVDGDLDGYGDPGNPANTCPVDNCPSRYNARQDNDDGDVWGNACDNCPDTPNDAQEDADGDLVGDSCDNCIYVHNPDQLDTNSNQIGEACECYVAMTGDVNVSGEITSADVIAMVNFSFKGGPPPVPCEAAGDVNCSGSCTSADIIHLVNYVFKGGPPPCDVCAMIPGTWSCP